MTPKPLSAGEREDIRYALCEGYNDHARRLVEWLFAAEKFWREAVKNAPDYFYSGVYRVTCPFCLTESRDEEHQHASTCPWLLAQEAE